MQTRPPRRPPVPSLRATDELRARFGELETLAGAHALAVAISDFESDADEDASARERSGEIRHAIGDHRQAERSKACRITVRVEHDAARLRRKARKRSPSRVAAETFRARCQQIVSKRSRRRRKSPLSFSSVWQAMDAEGRRINRPKQWPLLERGVIRRRFPPKYNLIRG